MRRQRRKSRVGKLSSTVIVALILTSVLPPLMLIGAPLVNNAKVVIAAGYTGSVSTVITNSLWIINPGGTFSVRVEVINNDNAPKDNVEVYAYVFRDNIVLNEGGWVSNKKVVDILAKGAVWLSLNITIKADAHPGEYLLRARARLPDNTTNDVTHDILVADSGICLKIGRWDNIIPENIESSVVATVANLTSTSIDNAWIYSHVFREQTVINENEWDGNKQPVSLLPGEIKNYNFGIKIKENVAHENFYLRVRLNVENLTWIQSTQKDFESGAAENLDVKSSPDNVKLLSLTANHLVISEVSSGTTGADYELVEIYNPTQENIYISSSNFKLRFVSSADVVTTKEITWIRNVVPAKGFFLLASPGTVFDPDATFSAGLTGTSGVIIDNDLDLTNGLIDRVAWGSPPPASGTEGTGIQATLATGDSIERKAKGTSTPATMAPSVVQSENTWMSLSNTLGYGNGVSAVYAENGGASYIYQLRGESTDFYRYRIDTKTWENMTQVPAAVGSGGALTYAENGGVKYLFALRGGGTADFYRYDVVGNSWASMATFGTVSAGGSLAWTGGDNIYAIRGGTAELWRYSITQNSWTQLASRYTFGTGAALAWGGGDILYAFKGGSATTFYRYKISTNSWTSPGNAAATPATVGAGGSLAWTEGDFIYAIRGGGNADFWRYSISGNSWETKASLPEDVGTNSGNRLVHKDNYLYYVRGVTMPTFWRYAIVATSEGGEDRFKGNGYDTDNNANDFVFHDGYYAPQNSASDTEQPVLEFKSSGLFTSAVYDAGQVVDLGVISWDETTTAETSLTVETRTSADNTIWSDWQVCDNGLPVPSPDNRYIQYRVKFLTTDVTTTPTLHEVRVGYSKSIIIDDTKQVRILPPRFESLFDWLAILDNLISETEQQVYMVTDLQGTDNLIKLNEIYANVAGIDQGNEWIEIYNTSKDDTGHEAVKISGWKVVDNEGTIATVPENVVLRPDEYYVFENFTNNMLNNAGENIWLRNKKGENIDFMSYSSTIEGKSLARIPNSTGSWIDNAELTKRRNNDDNSAGAAYPLRIDLARIRATSREYRLQLIENVKEIILKNADVYAALQYVTQYGSGITTREAEELVTYIQSNGGFPENLEQYLKQKFNMKDNNISKRENTILEHPDEIIARLPKFGLDIERLTLDHMFRMFTNSAAARLHVEAATYIESQPQDYGIQPQQYVDELDNRWASVYSDLMLARTCDNSLYEAIKLENWQAAFNSADNLMSLVENRALGLADEIHLARIARVYFRENGTPDNVRYAAEMELGFTKALDRYVYWYQKGLYSEMVAFGALNGDNETALDEAEMAQSTPFTTEVPSKNYVTVEELLANPSEYDNENVWIMGFVSDIQKKERTGGGEFSLFDLSTQEYVDNTQQRLRTFFPWGFINVSYGAGENSYAKIYGEFHATCENENGPDLHMGGIELFWDADIVPDNTPESWELLEPWKTIAYVEFAFTRRWGLAEYLENEVKTQIGGAIDVAYDIMGDTYREYGDFYISGVKGGYMYRAIDAMIVLHELMLDIEHNQHEHDYESLCAPVITTRGEDEGPSYPAGDSCGQDSIDAGDEGAESAAESCGDAGDDGGGC